MKCKECGSEEVIYSGVDAFCLGVQVGEYCYPCANYVAQLREVASK